MMVTLCAAGSVGLQGDMVRAGHEEQRKCDFDTLV